MWEKHWRTALSPAWKVWLLRTAIGWAGGAAIAWGVAFWVADYTMKAHTQTLGNTLAAMQASQALLQSGIEQVNATLITQGQRGDALAARTEVMLVDHASRLASIESYTSGMADTLNAAIGEIAGERGLKMAQDIIAVRAQLDSFMATMNPETIFVISDQIRRLQERLAVVDTTVLLIAAKLGVDIRQ